MVSGTMEEAPSIDTVYSVVNTLYTVPAESHRASMWLDDFSQSVRHFAMRLLMVTFGAQVHAWTLCDKMLTERRDAYSCMFAANCIRRKVHDNFAQLPAQSYDGLRQSLYNHIKCVYCINSSLVKLLRVGRFQAATSVPVKS